MEIKNEIICQGIKITKIEYLEKPINNLKFIFYFLCRSCRSKVERNAMYGKNMFEIWKEKYGLENANKMKIEYIKKHSAENNYWYGKSLTDEMKKKISDKNKGRLVGEKNPMYGKSLLSHWKESMSDKDAELKWEETKKKISDKNIGENNFFMVKHMM